MELGRLLSPRSIEDILAERIVLTLDGVEYVLPVKTMRDHREWERSLDRELVTLFLLVQDDEDDVMAVLSALGQMPGRFIDLLLSYDATNVLPDRDTIYAKCSELVLLVACLEVWRAAHPLADIGLALAGLTALRANALPGLTSLLWPNGASQTDDSMAN